MGTAEVCNDKYNLYMVVGIEGVLILQWNTVLLVENTIIKQDEQTMFILGLGYLVIFILYFYVYIKCFVLFI